MTTLTEGQLTELESVERTSWKVFVSQMGHGPGKKLWYTIQKEMDLAKRLNMFRAALLDVHGLVSGQLERPMHLKRYLMWKRQPVDVKTFIEHPFYLNKKGTIYPVIMDELVKINSGPYSEVVFTGGIGSGKTTAAIYSLAYQLYLMSCMGNPHETFGLDPSSEILLVFQSLNGKISAASFSRFKDSIQQSLYFQTHFPFKKDLTSKMVFPNRIEVVPISGQETGAIGQNVIGGLIDELNYMAVVDKSKQSVDGATYDQAVALYNSIARRRKSRFSSHGHMPGLLCLVSSKRYPGQFTDTKEEEAKRDPTIYIYDYRVWEVKPDSFDKGRFEVFAGDITRKPRVLNTGEKDKFSDEDQHLIVEVPTEFREEFSKDIINALREIAGISTLARTPYMPNVEAIRACFGKVPSVFSLPTVDFQDVQLRLMVDRIANKDQPRYAHIDLAITGDSAGLVIGHVPRFASMKELGYSTSEDSFMPVVQIDGILEIRPPKGGEILFYKIRDVLTKLRDYGMPITWVSFDSFQSRDSMQLLKQQGFIVGTLSMDVSIFPYDTLKQALYTGRVRAPVHDKCLLELVSLELDVKKSKVDHPPKGSKDCSDSLAGVVHGLTMRREVWGLHRIPLMKVHSMPSTGGGGGITADLEHRQETERRLKEYAS